MTTLQELLSQRAALEKQIYSIQVEQRSGAISQVKALMAEYGLTPADIGSRSVGVRVQSTGKYTPVAAKYRDPITGNAWSGRGLQPRWLKAALAEGKTLADFSLDAPAPVVAAEAPPVEEEDKPKATGPRRVKKTEAEPPVA